MLRQVRKSGNGIKFFSLDVDGTLVSMRFADCVCSATSDFGAVKKSNGFYARVCEIADVKPHKAVHIGDHWVFDFVNPREIGMTAYFLDRGRKRGRSVSGNVKNEEFVISDLSEILDKEVNGGNYSHSRNK